eukprot:7217985-Pyramimonas_sp.AAC.2
MGIAGILVDKCPTKCPTCSTYRMINLHVCTHAILLPVTIRCPCRRPGFECYGLLVECLSAGATRLARTIPGQIYYVLIIWRAVMRWMGTAGSNCRQ